MKTALRLAPVVLVVVSIGSTACAPAAAPTPAPAATKASTSAKPTAEASKPSAPATASVAKPAATASAAARPAASADWKTEWDTVLAAARKEGNVVVANARGETYRNATMAFQKAYPDIKVEYTGFAGADFAPKLAAERNAGQYLWDVYMAGPSTPVATLKPAGSLDPLKPALILPEVLDNRNWIGGLDDGWVDYEKTFVYGFDGGVAYSAYVNRDVVSESELNSLDQLLDAKWKGKIGIFDPRLVGSGSATVAAFLMVRGEDWVRRFLSQDLVVSSQGRPLAEAVFRGKYPIGIRLSTSDIQVFKSEGLTANVVPLDPTGPAAAAMGVGPCCATLINRPKHPNAAKVYINWLLSKDGQSAYVTATNSNSRRVDLDVKGDPETLPNPKLQYPNVTKEENQQYVSRAIDMAKEIIK